MHIALVVTVGSMGGPDEEGTATLHALVEKLETLPEFPLSIAFTGRSLRAVADDAPGMGRALADRGVELVRTAGGMPDLDLLPDPVIESALAREVELAAGLGLVGGGLAVTASWGSHTLPALARSGVSAVMVPSWRIAAPGVVSHLDTVLPVFGYSPGDEPPARSADDLLVVTTTTEGLAEAVRNGSGSLVTVDSYIGAHTVRGRARLSEPVDTTDRDLLRRKVIRLATRIPPRARSKVIERLVEAAASVTAHSPWFGTTDETSAHEALIEARRLVDQERRRGDEWSRVTRLDWDADGEMELQLELAMLSVVLDPEDGGALLALDDKYRGWPAGTVAGEPPGVLVRHQADSESAPVAPHLTLDEVEESKDRVTVTMHGTLAGGPMRCRLDITRRLLGIGLELEGTDPGRVGADLVLALPDARLRVDGGEWIEIDRPAAVAGHRIRLATDDREVLITSMLPVECFARPTSGGVAVWPHWLTDGTGRYEMTVDLAP